jgi:hypothetical protein
MIESDGELPGAISLFGRSSDISSIHGTQLEHILESCSVWTQPPLLMSYRKQQSTVSTKHPLSISHASPQSHSAPS